MPRRILLLTTAILAGAHVAAADPPSPSPSPSADGGADPDSASLDADAPPGKSFHGPFQSSRLFSMPVADVVGAYMVTISGDGSLLQQPGVLTAAGVLAVGFGDIAQLEYRHSAAISVTGVDAPLPGVGVQLKLPIPEHSGVPAFGVAFRLGVPRTETFDAVDVRETVTDLYLVGRLRIPGATWLTLHGGARVSSAKVELANDPTRPDTKHAFQTSRVLVLPTGGYEVAMNPEARIIGEIELAPQFKWLPGGAADPTIGYAVLGRFGLRWSLLPELTLDASLGYQLESHDAQPGGGLSDVVQQWDIRLGAEVFVPWGALACRAVGVFCEERRKHVKEGSK